MTNPLAFLKTDGEIPEGSVMDPHDSGWRKYFLAFFSMGILALGAVGVHFWGSDFLEAYKTFGGYVIDIVGIYIIGNVGYKVGAGVVNGKAVAATKPAAPTKEQNG